MDFSGTSPYCGTWLSEWAFSSICQAPGGLSREQQEGWGGASVDKALAPQAWRSEFGSSELCHLSISETEKRSLGHGSNSRFNRRTCTINESHWECQLPACTYIHVHMCVHLHAYSDHTCEHVRTASHKNTTDTFKKSCERDRQAQVPRLLAPESPLGVTLKQNKQGLFKYSLYVRPCKRHMTLFLLVQWDSYGCICLLGNVIRLQDLMHFHCIPVCLTPCHRLPMYEEKKHELCKHNSH